MRHASSPVFSGLKPRRLPRASIRTAGEPSARHLFGPTAAPELPRKAAVVSLAPLTKILSAYLKKSEIEAVEAAFQFSDQAHLSQYRQSGEPYITHPLAVAEICAHWHLDAQPIMAALLHDVIEDQDVTKEELAGRFGAKVAELVDGVSKLDKVELRRCKDAQAENFRKMMLAMARDVRVMLVKLADRLHNMRTLGAVPEAKRLRVARETLDIYAPIAHRLGLNAAYLELQDASFAHLYPYRYATLEKAVRAARGNRCEVIRKVLEAVKQALSSAQIDCEVTGREKTIYSIYKKMRDKQRSFSQVLDVYGVRIVVKAPLECYLCMGALHALYKPVPGKIKDYIAVPKINGYQSLHTTLVGPFGMPIEFQLRTRKMHAIAEAGVAAHWIYKGDGERLSDMQQRAHLWLKSLLDIQLEAGDASEFLEHVKIDLFPDAVYVFTANAEIISLPRGATALDFAYSVHSELGNQCVAVKINHEKLPLRTELQSGDIVEVIRAPEAKPNPTWLSFVRTRKARTAIRHYLKTMRFDESIQLGQSLVNQALERHHLSLAQLPPNIWKKLLAETGHRDVKEIFADIGLGRGAAAVFATRLKCLLSNHAQGDEQAAGGQMPDRVPISGTEGMSVQWSKCCSPIPGDEIIGCIGAGLGMAIHTTDCRVAQQIHRRDPNQWIDVSWTPAPGRLFDVRVNALVHQSKGILARITADITSAGANITHISMDEDFVHESAVLRLLIQVQDRAHLARVMRRARNNPDVIRIQRTKQAIRTQAA
ncbi:RelA/SpoT family protein [Candidatus Glomeribacter gigasporarum]|uniref:RelA/SpoT family protein n=1 Tax=Candidatus Glomeribacter gigasporarum TaxID=132144 RepID=UPI0009D94AC9